MGRNTKLSCRLWYPPTGSQEPCLFNEEPCTLLHRPEQLAIALREHGVYITSTFPSDGSADVVFRVPRRFFEPLKSVLVGPYVRPEPPPPTGCTKIVYRDEDAALRGAASMIKSPRYDNPSGDPLVPYVCEECRGWHIGHRYRQTIRRFDVKVGLPF